MSLRIGTALREGARRTFTRDGLVLVGVFVLIGLASTIAVQTIVADVFDAAIQTLRAEPTARPEGLTPQEIDDFAAALDGLTPFALPVSSVIAGLLFVLTAIVAEAATIVAIRTFFADGDRVLSGDLARRNIVLATLNGVVGGIVVYVVVAIGLVFLIIPGIFFAIAFLFLRQEIAVEDASFVDAMADSWQLTKGDRFRLFLLVVGVVIIAAVVSRVPPAVFGAISPTVGDLAGVLFGGVTTVFGTAVVTRAYAQLHADRAAVRNGDDTDEWAI